jgi:dynein intermediate chain
LSSGQITGDGLIYAPGTPTKGIHVHTVSVATQTLSDVEVHPQLQTSPAPEPETLSYSIGVQTTESWLPSKNYQPEGEFSDSEGERSTVLHSPKSKRLSRRDREKEEELRRNLRREIEEELKQIKDPTAAKFINQSKLHKIQARELTVDEVNVVTSSEEFLSFVERSSKVVERALESDYDILANYALDNTTGVDDEEDEGYASSQGKKGRRIKEVAQFYDERWSKKRMISDIGFSPKVRRSILTWTVDLPCHSSLSYCWQHIRRTRPLHKIRLVLFKYGIFISIRAQSTYFIVHLTFSQPSSRLSIHH